jgi:protein O-GlcNAc transferase
MDTALLLVILALQIFAIYYLIRTARNLGSKSTRYHNELMENINMLRASGESNLLNHLEVPNTKEFRNVSWDHVISLTSHPARFATLHIALDQLLNQQLIPKKIYLNIAQSDISKLPTRIKELESGGVLKINSCSDLGPGKKLIPTLKLEENLPIIVVDDDLFFETDLTLKLMVQHHLSPKNVVAKRVHKIIYEANGSIASYSKWIKNYSLSNGPASDLFPTSGAGTLYKKEFFHPDVMDEESYKALSLHTDDLWWFVHSKRAGVITKRMAGYSKLEFIDGTQENGLWNTGNKDRNDPNLKSLLSKYSL